MLLLKVWIESQGWWNPDHGLKAIGPMRDHGKGNEYHDTEASVKRQECDSILFTPKVAQRF